MLKQLLVELERRESIPRVLTKFVPLFDAKSPPHITFVSEVFKDLLSLIEGKGTAYQNVAVQAAVKWSTSSQRVHLRNAIATRGFLNSSCLWAYKQLRGNPDVLFRDYSSPEMRFMQVLLLKDTDPSLSVPFLIERFLSRREVPDEIRTLSKVCISSILEGGVSPEQIRSFRDRYPSIEAFHHWRPCAPLRSISLDDVDEPGGIDFHQMVRAVRDMKELSALTRTVYLSSLFYVPLSAREWESVLLSRTDRVYFRRLRLAGIVENLDGGFLLSADASRQKVIRKFLYDSYPMAREAVRRNHIERIKEEREKRVRSTELDRQALEVVTDGIICIDSTGFLYYLNPAAEKMLRENNWLKEALFGNGSVENALKKYSRERMVYRITSSKGVCDGSTQVFGSRIVLESGGKRFEVELDRQIILIRDTTDQHLINSEVGKLYRHELKAALDVMGAGIDTAKHLLVQGNLDEGLQFLDQVEKKRSQLFGMLEERIDFIRLHSDTFQIRPSKINLNLVIEKCVNNYGESVTGKDQQVTSNHLDVESVWVDGEERYLVRAVDNLIRNAVKFSEQGSTVSVRIGTIDGQAFVSVEDAGAGIASESLGKIFELGFTTGGSGRGLYLAKRIVEAHNGKIEVWSELGLGSCFTVKLPLALEA